MCKSDVPGYWVNLNVFHSFIFTEAYTRRNVTDTFCTKNTGRLVLLKKLNDHAVVIVKQIYSELEDMHAHTTFWLWDPVENFGSSWRSPERRWVWSVQIDDDRLHISANNLHL